MPKREQPPEHPEISIGPHPARDDWRVLRVSYPTSYEHMLRIGDAISVLLQERDSVKTPRGEVSHGD
jgi:hypothetical protein